MKSKWKWLTFSAALTAGFAAIVIALFVALAPNYDSMAERDFGGPAKAALLTALYEKIEGGDPADLGLVEVDLSEPEEYGFPKTRVLPQDLIPKECGLWFGHLAPEGGPTFPSGGEVLAHYDDNDRLKAIEF